MKLPNARIQNQPPDSRLPPNQSPPDLTIVSFAFSTVEDVMAMAMNQTVWQEVLVVTL
jgi:hypothetical protein